MHVQRGIISLVAFVSLATLGGARLASANTNCAAFRKEQRVEAQKDGAWSKSTIVRCDPRKGFLVHFDGFSSANDAWLSAADIRALAVATVAPPPASVAGLTSNDYVYIQRPSDPERFVARLWNAGPTTWSYTLNGNETRIDPADIKGKWDPSTMKYRVGQKIRYVAGGFYPAVVKSIEAGGYRVDISGGVTNTNVLLEKHFVDDWRYEELEQALAPLRQLTAMKLEWVEAFDRKTTGSLTPPHETAADAVPEFEKVLAAYAAVDQTLRRDFQDLPPLLSEACAFCPRRLADVVARHKQIFERAVPLDAKSAVEEFLRNMEPSENWYLNDYRPCDECNVLSAKDPTAKAKHVLTKRIGRQVAYAKALGIPPRMDLPGLDLAIERFIKKWDAMIRAKAPVLESFAKEGTSLRGKDAKLERIAKAYLASLYPTSRCKLLGTEKHDWRSHGTGDDHVGRFKYVAFDCSDPDYRYPFAVAVAVEQSHLGFGKYEADAHGLWTQESYYRR